MGLSVNGKPAGEGKVEKQVFARFSVESLDVGEDTLSPVAKDYPVAHLLLTGAIQRIDIDFPHGGSEHSPEEKKRRPSRSTKRSRLGGRVLPGRARDGSGREPPDSDEATIVTHKQEVRHASERPMGQQTGATGCRPELVYYTPGTTFPGVIGRTFDRPRRLAAAQPGHRRGPERPLHRPRRHRLRPARLLRQPHRHPEHRRPGRRRVALHRHAHHRPLPRRGPAC